MSSSEVLTRVGNVNTVIETIIQQEDLPGNPGTFIPFDLTNNSGSTIEVKKDDESIVVLVASVKTPPGTDGVLTTTDSAGIFDIEGTYYIRGVARLTGGSIFKGSWEKRIIGK